MLATRSSSRPAPTSGTALGIFLATGQESLMRALYLRGGVAVGPAGFLLATAMRRRLPPPGTQADART
jgi:hypothetical protein